MSIHLLLQSCPKMNLSPLLRKLLEAAISYIHLSSQNSSDPSGTNFVYFSFFPKNNINGVTINSCTAFYLTYTDCNPFIVAFTDPTNPSLARLNNVHRELLYYLGVGVGVHTNVKVFVKVFKTSLFPNLVTDLLHLWYHDTYWSKILRSTIPTILSYQGQGHRLRI